MRELPNLMQLRAFLRVAQHESVSRAADTLYRAQSVVTRAIRDLELRLGAPLFERHANGMRLTAQGACIRPRAQRALDELNRVPSLLDVPHKVSVEPLYLLHTRRLEIFIKLCDTHHMQTVANLFGLTQPAVSAAIKVLEGGTGTLLFERSPKGLLPTRAGREISVSVRRAVNELRHLDSDLAALNGQLEGRVAVGALPLCRTTILPDAVLRLISAHPKVQVVTNESAFETLATDLRYGDLDFILGALRPSGYASDLYGETLLTEELLVVARAGHPLSDRKLVMKDLHDAQWILPRTGSPSRELFDQHLAQAGQTLPRAAVETGDLAVIRGLLMNSDLLAVVSAHQMDYELASHALAPLDIPLTGTRRSIGLIQRNGALPSPAAIALMTAIRSVASGLPISSSDARDQSAL